MPSWEQITSRDNGIRRAAALLAEAVTVVAAVLRVLLSAVLAVATAVVRGDRARSPAPRRDRADPGRKADGWPDPAGWR